MICFGKYNFLCQRFYRIWPCFVNIWDLGWMSEKINELVLMVKEHIHLGEEEYENAIREIENQIDDKNLQIHDIFSRNIDSVIQHYIKHQEIISNQKRLQNYCEEFSKRVKEAEDLSKYDERFIERSKKSTEALKEKKDEVVKFRDAVSSLRKAAICIEEERYNIAIKLINSYKENQPTIDTPLKKALPIFREKVKSHLVKLVQTFWEINKPKIVDIGCLCYNKVELSTHEKTNIYQAFFGRNSAARNSLIRRSSIVEGGRTEAPLRFLKKVKDQQILQKYILRLNIDINSLKQMRILCKEMGEDALFQQIINKQMRKFITDICEENRCDSEGDLKKLLSVYIGFLLFRRQVVAFFNIEDESKVVFTQVYSFIGKQSKNLLSRPDNLSHILRIKSHLDIFHKVLQIVNLESGTKNYSDVLGEIFKIYCSFSLEQYEVILGQQIYEDNLTAYRSEDQYQQQMISEVLGVNPDSTGHYSFTRFVLYSLQIFNQFFDRMITFVKDSELKKSQLHDHLSSLFERIIAVYGGLLVINEHPLQIAQGQINLLNCETIYKHFSDQLETKYEFIRVSEPGYRPKLQTLIVELRRRMREVVEDKIIQIMCTYESDTAWNPPTVNNQPNQFLQWMLEFIKQIVLHLRKTESPAHEQMAYSWIGFISQLYWEYFEECKQFSLITIYNLDLDLLSIYKFVTKNFCFYRNIADLFKSLSEFYSLMLTNNINDILDKEKRDITYAHVDLNRLIPILKKYNKSKGNGGGKIRELKKKDVDAIVKKLEMQRIQPQH